MLFLSLQGAFAGLVIGFAIGIIRMGLEWSVAAPSCGSGEENDQFIVVQKVRKDYVYAFTDHPLLSLRQWYAVCFFFMVKFITYFLFQ